MIHRAQFAISALVADSASAMPFFSGDVVLGTTPVIAATPITLRIITETTTAAISGLVRINPGLSVFTNQSSCRGFASNLDS